MRLCSPDAVAPHVRALPILLVVALALPTLASATPIPDEVYRVVASHAYFGQGIGYMWGHPQMGARLWLETTFGMGEWGFVIGGVQDHRDTPLGTLVVDQWRRGSTERFVGTYFEDGSTADDAVDFAGTGGGYLNGWTIAVYGHT